MKLHLPITLLSAVLCTMAYGALDTVNHTSYTNFKHSYDKDTGAVTINVGEGNYTEFDMFFNTLDSNPTVDDGVIMGGSSLTHEVELSGSKITCVSGAPANNGTVSSVDITVDGGTNISKILGIGFKSCAVDGPITITVNSGSVDLIIAGVEYSSKANAVASGANNMVDKKPGNDVSIVVNGGTVGQIRGGHNTSSNAGGGVYTTLNNAAQKDSLLPEAERHFVADLLADNPYAMGGDVSIKVLGGTVGDGEKAIVATGGNGFSVDGNIDIVIGELGKEGPTVEGNIVAGSTNLYTSVGSTSVTINSGTITGNVYGGGDYDELDALYNKDGSRKNPYLDEVSPVVSGDSKIVVNGGVVKGNVYGAGLKDDVKGDVSVEINGGEIVANDTTGEGGNVYGAGDGSKIAGSATTTLAGGTVQGDVYGAGEGSTVGKDVEIVIDGADVKGNVYGAGKDSSVGGKATVQLLSGNVDGVIDADGIGSTVGGEATVNVGTDTNPYEGTVGAIEGFDNLHVSKGSRLNFSAGNPFTTRNQTYTLTAANLRRAAVVLSSGSSISIDGAITMNINLADKGLSGKYMIIDGSAIGTGVARSAGTVDLSNWTAENVTVTGDADFSDLAWEGNVLYFIYRTLSTDAALAANWGVFKSSQAFTGTLWANHANAVSLDKPKYNEKGALIPTEPSARNIAWGTVYGQSGRISGAGADYSLYGAAIGAERQFKTGRSLGIAFGYDWGKVSPFTTSAVDQDSWHAALYGRAAAWKLGKGAVALDWSAACGQTTSEHADIAGDWTQTAWQFDVRATYSRELTNSTSARGYVGVQYYTHDDAMAGGMHVSSVQNLRLSTGAGVSHKVGASTTLHGDVSVYADAMRHNPTVEAQGARFEGTEPGRIGTVLGVGVSYDINDKWSLNGGYSFDVAEDSKEHNANIGVNCEF